jgi:hypothetical protein
MHDDVSKEWRRINKRDVPGKRRLGIVQDYERRYRAIAEREQQKNAALMNAHIESKAAPTQVQMADAGQIASGKEQQSISKNINSSPTQ